MNVMQTIGFRRACNPVDAASGAITGITLDVQNSGIQIGYVGCLVSIGNCNNVTTVFEIQESASDFSGSAISGLAFTALSGSSDNTLYCAGFPLGGPRLRYYRLMLTASGTCLVSATWLLFGLGQTPSSVTERGVVEQLFI